MRCPVLEAEIVGIDELERSLGVEGAEAVSTQVSARLAECIRNDDVVRRTSRSSHLVLATDPGHADAAQLLDRLRSVMAPPFIVDGRPVVADVELRVASDPGATAEPFRALVEASTDVSLIVDARWQISYATPSLQVMFGFAPDDVIGRRFWNWIVPGTATPSMERVVTKLSRPGDRAELTAQLTAADGTRRWVQVSILNQMERSDVHGFVITIHDVTASADVLAGLRIQQERIAAIIEHSTVAVMFFEGDGTIAWVSPTTSRLFGLAPDELVGHNGFEMIHPDDRAAALEGFASLVPGGHVQVEFRVVDGQGRVRWIEESVTDLVGDPDVGYVVGNLRDVTDRREAEREVRFQAELLDAVGRAIIVTGPTGVVQYWNPAAEQLYGWSAEEAHGRSATELIMPPDTSEDTAARRERLRRGENWSDDLWLQRRDGSRFFASVVATVVLDDCGEVEQIIGIATDLTERLEMARAAEVDRRRLVEAQHTAHLGSFEVRLPDGASTWSDELYNIFGLPVGSPASPRRHLDLVHPDDRAAVKEAGDRAVRAARSRAEPSSVTEDVVEVVYRIIRPDGELRWLISRTSSLSEGGRTLAGTTQDITERHQAEERLAHQAEHDPLTELPNRVRLTRHLEGLLERQTEGGPPATVTFLDLDRFKVINDGLGHAVGDQVLIEAGRRLTAIVDDSCMVGRFGGDEFVVICDELVDPDAAVAAAERIGACLEEPFHVEGRQFFLSASVGVAISRVGDDAESVLQAADTAMYEAKKLVGTRAHYFDDRLQRHKRERLDLENDLRQALGNGELELHYQPIIRLEDEACVGFESLLRWNHPVAGMVRPDEFIPLAEETGLILPIGEWVLQESLAQLGRWQIETGYAQMRVAVNLSANQLVDPALIERVSDTIDRSGVAPDTLHLEITESVLMDGIEGSLRILNALRAVGVRLAVDDFGTGYSSLSYLKRLPVDVLKIDRSFVDGLGSDPHDTSIVQAITAMAEALGLEILAEGVETSDQLDALRELGCELAQGFWWSRPLPADQALAWFRARPRT